MGAVTVQDTSVVSTWTTVTFIQPFPTTPLVFALPTNEGTDPSTIRVRNVTTTGFEIVMVEPSANDGPHAAMNTAYLAIEPGDHTLPDGTQLSAFTHITSSFANRFISTTWDTVPYPSPFTATPAILAQIQTVASESGTPPATSSIPFMDAGIRNVGTGTFQTTLDRVESTAGMVSSPETIAILAIDAGTDITFVDALQNSIQLQSLRTPNNVRGWGNGCFTNNYAATFSVTPIAVASANSRNGNNGGWVRRCSQSNSAIGLTIDEDIDNDTERNHINETAGVVAASADFHANFDVDLLVTKTVSALSDPVNAGSNPKSIPDSTVGYTVSVQNRGSVSPDNDSVEITDDVPTELALCVTAACFAGGPVVLDVSGSPIPPGVTIGSVDYSDDGGLTFTYVPVPDADGFDPAVTDVRVTMAGTLAPIGTGGEPSFELQFAARVE
ncbi:MAG: hypothetical protein AAF351_04095 [Pseudomonadota bacterium]